ncbi:TetR/AcrR family transcriptional regulator [Neobacillus notoginsengisoli]|uniref:TetR/AcrR family transcriptional regulator n=1 Tax=Neobacillus notoginsengisoli TaxID=1578198 RepID=A0A417YTA8_9BACI|nr:TetR/AcrR family transcriptional regulator [Neobacillus notoginsengisoli]RHW40269.1 TetR/AcrR family transcriptional regulator [Neobacillus notoginsengisoli]
MSDQDLFDEELFEGEELTEKQKKILIAAIESFSEKGFAATSTNEIAKKAGVAEGTIFRHYKTKKELLLNIVSPVMAKLVAPFVIRDFDKVLNKRFDTFEEFLRAVFKNRHEFIEKNSQIIRILLQEIPFQPELREQFKEHVAAKLFERFTKAAAYYQEKGQLLEIPPASALRMTASSIIGYFIAKYVIFPESEWDDEVEMERTIQFILRGLGTETK